LLWAFIQTQLGVLKNFVRKTRVSTLSYKEPSRRHSDQFYYPVWLFWKIVQYREQWMLWVTVVEF